MTAHLSPLLSSLYEEHGVAPTDDLLRDIVKDVYGNVRLPDEV